jgi:aliphatic nitrilase
MVDHEQIHCSQFPGSMVGSTFTDQMEVTIRHHALESGCFVVNSTGWLREEQIEAIAPQNLQKALTEGCMTAIISPEGKHLADPITEGEGILYADLDLGLIQKRKRMMDSVGHYARPELLSLQIDRTEHQPALYQYGPPSDVHTTESRIDADGRSPGSAEHESTGGNEGPPSRSSAERSALF